MRAFLDKTAGAELIDNCEYNYEYDGAMVQTVLHATLTGISRSAVADCSQVWLQLSCPSPCRARQIQEVNYAPKANTLGL